jgi:arsenate reductase
MVHVYGIPNCGSVKNALTWLKENDVAFEFHDFKKEGITTLKLREWLKTSFPEKILNKKSIAYKNLPAFEQQKTTHKNEAIKLMQTYTNLIKRPVLEIDGIVLHGFNKEEYKIAFGKK